MSHLIFQYPKLLISVALVGTPITYLIYLHQSLSRKINHVSKKGILTSTTTHRVSTIPTSAISSDHLMYYDMSSIVIRKTLLPSVSKGELLTMYLRHNMCLFSSRFPQAWILRLMCTREERASFTQGYLQNLKFEEGDLVNGVYRILVRSGGKVELELKTAGAMQGGRLLIEIVESGDNYMFVNETVMWKEAGEKAQMPMERGLAKGLHELASWWLLDAGTRFLIGLKEQKGL
ncbi:hypothetical protein BGZ60DRAFT_409057 [Tricladium varicosporioides]|nr:hypothetical protein BGZ60DRAFT_409057 [Hymenoscyphus varicosporioides]